jgi:hypothetical protein
VKPIHRGLSAKKDRKEKKIGEAKMKIPSFKALIQKLSVLKSNSSLLAPIVIALVAIVLFAPNQLLSGRLKRQIESESVAKGTRVKGLDVVPREQLTHKEKYDDDYAKDANQIEDLAKRTTQRELLSYEIFPKPNDTSALIFTRFGQKFRAGTEQLLAQVRAGDCPTDAEIDRALEQSSSSSRPGARPIRPRSSASRSWSMPYGGYGYGYGKMAEINRTIFDEICLEKAKSASVYAHPLVLSGYDYWGTYQYAGADEALKHCWYWQLGYWIIEDVIDTIAAMNSGSTSVFTSPVKRLLRVEFGLSGVRRGPYVGFIRKRTQGGKEQASQPSYVRSLEEALIVPCTARFCDDDIDVVHFRMAVVISADKVLPFMEQLCSAKQHKFRGYFGEGPEQTLKHNQIAVLESSMKSFDQDTNQDHALYRYGEDAVVELDLICEYVLNKAGYKPIKPEAIEKELKAEVQTSRR